MKIIITAATVGEWMPSFLNMPKLYTDESKRMKIFFHASGVGMLASAVSFTRLILQDNPDLIIQVGIAGSFNNKLKLGDVVVVNEEKLGDMGVMENNKWKDIFDLKLEKNSYPPFEKRTLPNHCLSEYNLLQLQQVNAVTVNTISTDENIIKTIVEKYNPAIESMEGAALHYVCRELNTPFLQIRSISNYIGERDKTKWKMQTAIDNLNKAILQYADKLYKIL
jgi:futalosine hydrolase